MKVVVEYSPDRIKRFQASLFLSSDSGYRDVEA